MKWFVGQIIRVPFQNHCLTIRASRESSFNSAGHRRTGSKRLAGELAIIVAIYHAGMIILPIRNDFPDECDADDEACDSHSKFDDNPISLDVINYNPCAPYRVNSDAEAQAAGLPGNFLGARGQGPQDLDIKVEDYVNLNEVVSVEYSAGIEHVSELFAQSVELSKKRYEFVHGPVMQLSPERQELLIRKHVKGEHTGFEPNARPGDLIANPKATTSRPTKPVKERRKVLKASMKEERKGVVSSNTEEREINDGHRLVSLPYPVFH